MPYTPTPLNESMYCGPSSTATHERGSSPRRASTCVLSWARLIVSTTSPWRASQCSVASNASASMPRTSRAVTTWMLCSCALIRADGVDDVGVRRPGPPQLALAHALAEQVDEVVVAEAPLGVELPVRRVEGELAPELLGGVRREQLGQGIEHAVDVEQHVQVLGRRRRDRPLRLLIEHGTAAHQPRADSRGTASSRRRV